MDDRAGVLAGDDAGTGEHVGVDDNPIVRWTAGRKAKLLEDLASGVATPADLVKLHGIGPEELEEWRKLYYQHGKKGLRTTRVQMYRK